MKKIYVGNLPFSATEDEVRELFEAHGTVESVNLITDRDTGRPRGDQRPERQVDGRPQPQHQRGTAASRRPLRRPVFSLVRGRYGGARALPRGCSDLDPPTEGPFFLPRATSSTAFELPITAGGRVVRWEPKNASV